MVEATAYKVQNVFELFRKELLFCFDYCYVGVFFLLFIFSMLLIFTNVIIVNLFLFSH